MEMGWRYSPQIQDPLEVDSGGWRVRSNRWLFGPHRRVGAARKYRHTSGIHYRVRRCDDLEEAPPGTRPTFQNAVDALHAHHGHHCLAGTHAWPQCLDLDSLGGLARDRVGRLLYLQPYAQPRAT